MPTLPPLKTGAVMQYPAPRATRYGTHIVRYVDGSEQRYREQPAPLKEWVIRLDLLDETELAALEEFFVSQKGQFGSFTFVDPGDQISYPDCSLAGDGFDLDLASELRGKTTLTVRENRP